MHENVRAVLPPDKAEALGIVKPLDCSSDSRHLLFLRATPSRNGKGADYYRLNQVSGEPSVLWDPGTTWIVRDLLAGCFIFRFFLCCCQDSNDRQHRESCGFGPAHRGRCRLSIPTSQALSSHNTPAIVLASRMTPRITIRTAAA